MEAAAGLLEVKEDVVYGAVDVAAFISNDDLNYSFPPHRRVRGTPALTLLRPSVRIVPPRDNASAKSFAGRSGLVFLGSGGVETNYQGVQWFLKYCWPEIRRRIADIKFTIVGKPPGGFSACRKRGAHCTWQEGSSYTVVDTAKSGLVIAGFLKSEELNELLQRARIFVEPIVSSTGINTKAFTGFEHDIPVLMTEPAASGLHIDGAPVPNTVPPDPGAFTRAVVRMHENEAIWVEALRAQRTYVTALNAADLGRRDAVALVRKVQQLREQQQT